MPRRSPLVLAALVVIGLGAAAGVFVLASWVFTTGRLNAARAVGVFPSPAEGMLALTRAGYVGLQEARIMDAGPDTAPGGGPHIWFVTVCVWAEARANGLPVGNESHDYDFGGSYFVNTAEGWVLVPESSFPLLVGFWMPLFNLAGEDVAQPVHDPAQAPGQPCVRTNYPVLEPAPPRAVAP